MNLVDRHLIVSDLSGGLNVLSSDKNIRDNELIDCVNMVYDELGILKVRKGYKKFNEIPLSGVPYSLYRFYKSNGNKYFIATAEDDIYYWDGSEFQLLTLDYSLTANKRFQFATLEDKVFMVNGSDVPMKWAGGSTVHVKRMGIVAPVGTVNIAQGSSGNVNAGVHYYRITYYNSVDAVESAPLGIGQINLPVASHVDIGTVNPLPTSSDPQVSSIKIYRTIAGGNSYYYVATISNGTATYDDNYSDSEIQTNAAMSSYVENADMFPDGCKYICSSHNRIFMAGEPNNKSRLYFSEPGYPEYCPADTNFIDVNADDGDEITAIIAWRNRIYVFKETGTYYIPEPSVPLNSAVVQVSSFFGNSAPYSACVGLFYRPMENYPEVLKVEGIIMKSNLGIVGFDGSQFYPLDEKIKPIVDNIYEPNKNNVMGFFWDGKYRLAYCPKTGKLAEAGFVQYSKATTDSGGERRNALYHEDYSEGEYDENYDARVILTHTSSENVRPIYVNIIIPWTTADLSWSQYAYCYFKIYASKDNGSTWEVKGNYEYIFEQIIQEGEIINQAYDQKVTFKYEDKEITDIMLLYYGKKEFYTIGNPYPFPLYITLESVNYEYEYETETGVAAKNSRMLYYDSMVNCWSLFRGQQANCFCVWDKNGDRGEMFFGSAVDGYVYQMDVGNDDDGKEIFIRMHTKAFDLGRNVRFQQILLNMDLSEGVAKEYFLELFIDRIERFYNKFDFMLDVGQVPFWGADFWGNFTWDQLKQIQNVKQLLPSNCLGRLVSLRFWANVRGDIEFTGFKLKVNAREKVI